MLQVWRCHAPALHRWHRQGLHGGRLQIVEPGCSRQPGLHATQHGAFSGLARSGLRLRRQLGRSRSRLGLGLARQSGLRRGGGGVHGQRRRSVRLRGGRADRWQAGARGRTGRFSRRLSRWACAFWRCSARLRVTQGPNQPNAQTLGHVGRATHRRAQPPLRPLRAHPQHQQRMQQRGKQQALAQVGGAQATRRPPESRAVGHRHGQGVHPRLGRPRRATGLRRVGVVGTNMLSVWPAGSPQRRPNAAKAQGELAHF